MLDVSPKGTVPVLVLAAVRLSMRASMSCCGRAARMTPITGSLIATTVSLGLSAATTSSKAGSISTSTPTVTPSRPNSGTGSRRAVYSGDESQLSTHDWLGGNHCRLCDVAVFPFVRQFAGVDPTWWQSAPYPSTRAWLDRWLADPLFTSIMKKYPQWQPGDQSLCFGRCLASRYSSSLGAITSVRTTTVNSNGASPPAARATNIVTKKSGEVENPF